MYRNYENIERRKLHIDEHCNDPTQFKLIKNYQNHIQKHEPVLLSIEKSNLTKYKYQKRCFTYGLFLLIVSRIANFVVTN